MSRRASFARSSDSSRLLNRAKARTFLRAPSSSRTLERMCLAMKNAMSSDNSIESASAFFSTIATRIWALVGKLVADGLEKVRLAEAHAAVDEQRVVRNPRIFGHLYGSRARELVGFAGHEAVERKRAV